MNTHRAAKTKSFRMNRVIIDMQGFLLEGKFVPKEMSISKDDGCHIYSYFFKPSIPFQQLSRYDKNQIWWLEHNHHKIQYRDGFLELSNIADILRKFVNKDTVIYLKGFLKVNYLKTILANNVVNLELDIFCPRLAKCNHTCVYHIEPYSACSTENVKILCKYIQNLQYIE